MPEVSISHFPTNGKKAYSMNHVDTGSLNHYLPCVLSTKRLNFVPRPHWHTKQILEIRDDK